MPESKQRKNRNKAKGPTRSRTRQEVATAKSQPPSPTWYVVLMTVLMAVGVVMVVARLMFALDQWILYVGLLLIAVGFLMTTSYR
jgi:uncharacterized membrane protein HdeD (DUF308 family)